jgi:hypothetical protein
VEVDDVRVVDVRQHLKHLLQLVLLIKRLLFFLRGSVTSFPVMGAKGAQQVLVIIVIVSPTYH